MLPVTRIMRFMLNPGLAQVRKQVSMARLRGIPPSVKEVGAEYMGVSGSVHSILIVVSEVVPIEQPVTANRREFNCVLEAPGLPPREKLVSNELHIRGVVRRHIRVDSGI